eukprot:CAMPEP_0115862896 /NCGR_PEP_ID=MMETSP0287-20121206/18415_1 /TAXON_ID=412157 /ORGANISM="Chrysochromulina rotalis, Strain UIO044" /LENGTH=40 /DNA_ID= /DNA_START= /DNA_END= /DNA_ORIENTATION=
MAASSHRASPHIAVTTSKRHRSHPITGHPLRVTPQPSHHA